MKRNRTIFHSRSRGTIYLLVLGMSMLLSVIALGGIMAARVQCRSAANAANFSSARACARAGIEMGMYRMRTDPMWRTHLGNGPWYSGVVLGSGSFSVTASDPISGDITQSTNHPVLLSSTGAAGSAVYQLQMSVQPYPDTDVSCIEVSACAGGNIQVTGCTLNSDQTITANGNLQPDGSSIVNANAEAYGGFGNGTYSGSKTLLSAARTLPNSASVFSYYESNGTTISFNSLLQSNATNIVPNGSFESNITGWYVASPSSTGVVLSQSTAQHKDGSYALLLTGRAAASDLPASDLPLPTIRNGDTYQIQLPVYAKSAGTVQAQLQLVSDTGTQTFTTTAATLQSNGAWVTTQGSVTLSWSGNLQRATLQVLCSDNTCDLYVDAVKITDTSFSGGAYVMDRVLLSPSCNPYGTVNAQGIYIIDCGNKNVTITSCRIIGTLVLANASSSTVIQGPFVCEPAVGGYPAILCDNKLTISMNSSVGLSESTIGINLNPAGIPYPYLSGSSNTTVSDGYPTIINGLVYCNGDLALSGSPRVAGNLICSGNMLPAATTLNLTFGNASYVNPPPGFGSGAVTMKPLPGSWQRVTH